MIFCVDFDGTLVYDEYPEIGQLRPGARQVMWEAKARGHRIIIWTCRTGPDQVRMMQFLRDADIPFDVVNDHDPDMAARYGGDARKVFAHYYIDDHNVTGWSWAEIHQLITTTLN
jgi:hypothetical protein